VEVEASSVDDKMIGDLNAVSFEASKPFGEKEAHLLDGINVLLVDDAPDNQALISRFLTLAGATVDLASNGQEGMDKALTKNYKVILMDIQMPFLDGYEATMQLRSQGYTRPIIALTAHALKEERDRCLKVGCNDHLTKPIDRRQLISQVARIVSQAAF
jgi:CheY-like chemotaxis protein